MIKIEKLAAFDIETVGEYATLEELEEAKPRMAALWEKRCEFLRNRYPQNAEMTDAELYREKAGLHAEFSKVACVSFGIYKSGKIIMQSKCSADEVEVLEWTADMLDKSDRLGMRLAGHTIERFDIPVLWKRFLANGIKPPKLVITYDVKPWDLTSFDLAKFWSGGVWQESFVSLDTMSAMFGVDSPKDAVQANKVHDIFWTEGDLDKIQTYCEGDVRATIEVIEHLADTVTQTTAP